MPGSFSASQIYGRTQAQFKSPQEAAIVEASSPLQDNKSNPMYYWLALVGLLVVMRVLYEMAE